jgi:integrase
MQPHVARAFRLAAWTGLPRGDLITLRWNEIGDLYISRNRNKTDVETVIPLFDQTLELLKQFPRTAVTVVTNRRGKPFKARGFAMAVERARAKANVADGKTLNDVRGTFATRLMRAGFEDREIDEILGWETGKSQRIRRKYISRRAIVISAIERMRSKS